MISFPNSELMLITGASSGIGKASALLCNELGARIVAVGRDKERLQALKNEAKFPENMHLEARDLVEDLEALAPWVTELRKEYGKFSGFVHCAGHGLTAPFKVFDLKTAQTLFDVHYYAAMLLSRGICDKRNCEKHASIVFISSLSALHPIKSLSTYSSAKGALQSVIHNMSAELAPQGLRVNCVSPAYVTTPLVKKYTSEFMGFDVLENDKWKYPLGFITPEDVAQSIVFLLSGASSKITGQNIPIYGGNPGV